MPMRKEDIEARIAEIDRAIFYEEMADFMNWSRYYKLTAEKQKLQKMLKLFN